jgi:hypothetical protein
MEYTFSTILSVLLPKLNLGINPEEKGKSVHIAVRNKTDIRKIFKTDQVRSTCL